MHVVEVQFSFFRENSVLVFVLSYDHGTHHPGMNPVDSHLLAGPSLVVVSDLILFDK